MLINEPIKRYKIRHLAKAKSSILEIKSDETINGFNCSTNRSFQVSHDGRLIYGPRIDSDKKWVIAQADIDNKKFFDFPQVHRKYIETVLLHEEFNLIMSGSGDGLAVIYELTTRRIKHKLDMGIGDISSGIRVNNIAILGGKKTLGFLNLISGNEIELLNQIKLDCSFVLDLVIGLKKCKSIEKDKSKTQNMLITGGQGSSILNFIKMNSKFAFITKNLESDSRRLNIIHKPITQNEKMNQEEIINDLKKENKSLKKVKITRK